MARRRRLSSWQKKAERIGRALLPVLISCIAAYCLLAVNDGMSEPSQPAAAVGEENCAVHFIDVGQGDSTLILSDGSSILIDAGENDQGKTVCDYLDGLGITKIDLLVMTHPHSDHIGGMDTVIKAFEIGQILMPRLPDDQTPTTKTYTEVLTAIADKGKRITPARVGDVYTFGQGALTVLGPTKDYEDLNDTSLICRFDYGEQSFLFTGDMEKTAEEDLIEEGAYLFASVLKVGHHGSPTSTSEAFYDLVDPEICVISVGEGNSYGHPSKKTLKTIAGNGAEIYRTDYQGSVVVAVSGGELYVTTEIAERAVR